jgi:DNA-binding transcriptional LysR family regulator
VPITEVLLDLVRAELGVGVVHRWVAAPQIRSGALHACRLTRAGLWKTWKAVFARRTPHRAALTDLVSMIRGGAGDAGRRRRAAAAS